MIEHEFADLRQIARPQPQSPGGSRLAVDETLPFPMRDPERIEQYLLGEKVERLAVARGIPVLVGPPAGQLGAALGSPPVQAVGVGDAALARGLVAAFGGVSGHDADS